MATLSGDPNISPPDTPLPPIIDISDSAAGNKNRNLLYLLIGIGVVFLIGGALGVLIYSLIKQKKDEVSKLEKDQERYENRIVELQDKLYSNTNSSTDQKNNLTNQAGITNSTNDNSGSGIMRTSTTLQSVRTYQSNSRTRTTRRTTLTESSRSNLYGY